MTTTTTIAVSPKFTKSSAQPATGLTLSEIDITLVAVAKADEAVTVIWNTQNPTKEAGVGVYLKSYAADLDTYWYYAAAHYTGATVLDSDYVGPGEIGLTALPATSLQADRNAALVESQRGFHTWAGNVYYVDPVGGDTHANGNRGSRNDPYLTIQDCHDNAVTDSNHDVIILVAGAAAGVTTHTVAATTTISKRYTFIRGPGRDFIITRTGNGNTISVTADGVELSGFQLGTSATGTGVGVSIVDADFARIHNVWVLDTQGDGINILRGSNCHIHDNHFEGTGVSGSGQGIHVTGLAGASDNTEIHDNHFSDVSGDGVLLANGATLDTAIYRNVFHDGTGWGVNISASSTDAQVFNNIFGNNASGDINDGGTDSILFNNNIPLEVADATLKRGISNVEDTADTTSLAAIVLAILESSVADTSWTIRKTGGTTFVVKTVTVDTNASPVTGVT